MKCPYCLSGDTKVVDTRETADSDVTRRRRECLKCKRRFTTYERVEVVDLIVVKKDKSREPFDRTKVMRGIMKACEKRPIQIEKIEAIVDEIEQELRSKNTREIPSRLVGELVMEKLKKLDEVAYVRFASVYRQFKDAKQFVNEIEEFLKRSKSK
jgi:transcriptional repressor NrdR